MNDKFVVSTNEIGEIIVTDVETDRVYRYNDISKVFGLIRLLNEQQATINILLEELVNAQQQGYVVGFLHKNGRCNLLKGDE